MKSPCAAIVVLLGVLDYARAYECDAGKHNATERAPCAGWPPAAASAHNWSTCELVLGCCWQLTDPADNASLVCYAPNHHPPAPAPLPAITNPVLAEMGFFGQPAADAAGFLPLEQNAFVTFGSANDVSVLAQGAALGLRAFFRTQDYLVDKSAWNASAHRGNALFPDYENRWRALAGMLRPWVRNGTIAGFFLGDELAWGGLPYADLVAMADMVAATEWHNNATTIANYSAAAAAAATALPIPPPRPILYYNEAAGPIARDVDCFNDSIGYVRVPAAVDWISLDFYNPPAAFVRQQYYEAHLYPLMERPSQRALLVPDASASAHLKPNATGSRSGWSVPDMVARAREYFAWAATDTSGKVVGLNPWHYRRVTWGGDHDDWELGVRDVPALKAIWTQIGAEIKQQKKKTALQTRGNSE